MPFLPEVTTFQNSSLAIYNEIEVDEIVSTTF